MDIPAEIAECWAPRGREAPVYVTADGYRTFIRPLDQQTNYVRSRRSYLEYQATSRRGRRLHRLRTRLSEAQNHRCCYCGVAFEPGHPKRHPTIEHVIPASKGGMTNWWNCVMACIRCNNSRGNRCALAYYEKRVKSRTVWPWRLAA